MDRAIYSDHLRADSAVLLAAQQAEPDAPVWPGLVGWDRTRLLSHVGNVHGWMRAQLTLGPQETIDHTTVERAPKGDELVEWFEAGVVDFIDRIAAMDVEATWPTWAGPQSGLFFPRRAAQETAVHRWDAVGGPIDAPVGVDGIDELLERFAPLLPAERFAGLDGTLHLHATDVEGEWLVRLGPTGVSFERGHAKGDAALRGQAGDLLLWAWNRVPPDDDRFEVFGDPGLLAAWTATVTF